MAKFTAVYKKRGKWYLGWVEEVPGVNTQGGTLKEVRENLKEALALVLSVNKVIARRELRGARIIREPVSVLVK